MQILDAGVIALMRSLFLRRLLFPVFEDVEAETKSVCNTDVIRPTRWVAVGRHALSLH